MFNHLTATQKGMAFALIGYTAFAFSDICVKYLSEAEYSNLQIIASITGIGACLMLVFSSKLGGIHSLKDKHNLKTHGLRIFFNTGTTCLFMYCISQMPIASLYTVIFTLPFVASILSMFIFKERVGWHRWLSIVIGFSGIVIAFQPWQADTNLYLIGVAFVNTVFIACTFLSARGLKEDTSVLAVGFFPVIGSCILLSPLAAMDFTMPSIEHIPIFIGSGVLMSAGIIFVSLAFRTTDSAVVTPIVYTEIIWAVIFGALIFGDFPDIWMLFGVAVIIASGVYLVHREHAPLKRS